MSGDEKEKCDKIRQTASKSWLRPASVSLQKLDEIRANVYNLNLTDARQIRGQTGPGNHGNKVAPSSHRGDDPEIPLNKLTSQQNIQAWGSNGSIPHLIRNQIARQKTRPESAKITRLNRPPSGKKTRPQSAKDTAVKISYTGRTNKTVGGIKGERCDRVERPDGASVHLAGTGWVAPSSGQDNTIQDVADEQDDEYEYLYTNDPAVMRQQGYMEYIDGDGDPPPPPRGSPDFMQMLESQGLEADDDGSYGEMINNLLETREGHAKVTKPPQLLRKPKPEPISFSVPTAETEDDELRYSFDENGILINKMKYSKHEEVMSTKNKKKSRDKSKERDQSRSPRTLVSDDQHDFSKPEKSELSKELYKPEIMTEEEMFSYPKRVQVNLVIENPGGKSGAGLQVNLAPVPPIEEHSTMQEEKPLREEECTIKAADSMTRENFGHIDDDLVGKDQTNVQFDDNLNTMIEITPRQAKKTRPQSAKAGSYSGRRELRHVKSRTDSGVNLSSTRKSKPLDPDTSEEEGSPDRQGKLVRNRPKSGNSRPKLSTVTVNYMEELASDEERKFQHDKWSSKKALRRTPEVETCMTHYYSSDDNNLDLSIEGHSADEAKPAVERIRPASAKTVSSPTKNYFEMMRSLKHPGSDSEGEERRLKTVKTIELTGDGCVKETISVSAIDALEQKAKKEFVAPRPSSAKRPTSAKVTATVQPEVVPREHPEPTEDGIHGDSMGLSSRPIKRRPRVSSAPVDRPPDPLALKIAEIHRSKHDRPKCQPCGCKDHQHTHSHSTSNISKMASRDKSARRYYTGYNSDKKDQPKIEVPEKIVEIWTRKDDYEIETEGLKECKDIHMRLLAAGVPVSLNAIKRGLLPPTEYGFAGPTYKSTTHPNLPPNYTESLLSNPSQTWLASEHQRVKLAQKKVREATAALEEQRIEEAREALAAEARALKQSRRKKSGKKKKRTKSVK